MVGNGDFHVTCRIFNKPLKLGIDTVRTKTVKPFTKPATSNRSRKHDAILLPSLMRERRCVSLLDASALERDGYESRLCLARVVPSCHPRN